MRTYKIVFQPVRNISKIYCIRSANVIQWLVKFSKMFWYSVSNSDNIRYLRTRTTPNHCSGQTWFSLRLFKNRFRANDDVFRCSIGSLRRDVVEKHRSTATVDWYPLKFYAHIIYYWILNIWILFTFYYWICTRIFYKLHT